MLPTVAYGLSKAAAESLTRYLAKHCGPAVRVNAVCAGSITPDGQQWPTFSGILDTIPSGRTGRPRDVANAAVFLASDAASYTTGQVLFVDGGRSSAVS
jgi:NAD(P)-dependent dehydrogenase (short-subunit alcohol dehydrogenase family)